MRRPANELRQLIHQWHDTARDAERGANGAALVPAMRKQLGAQARAYRHCAQELTRVLKEVGLS